MDLFDVFYVKRYGYSLRERTCEPLSNDKPGSFSHCHSAKKSWFSYVSHFHAATVTEEILFLFFFF